MIYCCECSMFGIFCLHYVLESLEYDCLTMTITLCSFLFFFATIILKNRSFHLCTRTSYIPPL